MKSERAKEIIESDMGYMTEGGWIFDVVDRVTAYQAVELAEQVRDDLEIEGYEVQPFVLPACSVNAPHRRYRVFIVAHRSDAGSEDMCQREDGLHAVGVYADTDSKRLSIAGQTRKERSGFKDDRIIRNWERFPTESPVCRRDDGFPGGLDGITFPSWCRKSVKAYGNAIVPQVALRIFETINDYERQCE